MTEQERQELEALKKDPDVIRGRRIVNKTNKDKQYLYTLRHFKKVGQENARLV